MTFQELGVAEPILRAIDELGFAAPMPVQEAVIPYLLGVGNDVIALAQTGTGKTAAYGIPLIQKIDVTKMVTQAIVICPTRELCLQITGDMRDFSKNIEGLHIVPVYGGASIESQIRGLKRGAQIIVATPGRLIDLMERGAAHLDKVENVVLDEADEMLNMGFSESIDAILAGVPAERNTLLFSATMSKEIEKIAQRYLHNAKEIVVGSRNEGAELVNHEYYLVHARDKYLALKRIVDYYPKIYAIIFCRTRVETQEVSDKLIQDGYSAEALHGDLSQAQRDVTMQKFRQHHTQLLVATDVAARGLDVEDLTHVINYGLPDDVENYTHRSGRTGRAGKKGTSISIIHLREKGKIRQIEKTIGKDFILKTLPSPQEICTKQLYKVIDQLEKAQVDEEQIGPFLPEIFRKLDWLDKEDIIKRFVSMEFGRFLEYYAHAPEIQTPQQSEMRERENRGRQRSGDEGRAEQGFVRFFFGAGKRDHYFAREIIGLINRYTMDPVDIGKIDLMMNFSFFEVPEKDAAIVEGAMRNVKDKTGRRIVVERADKGSSHESADGRKGGKRRSEGGYRDEKDKRSHKSYKEKDNTYKSGKRNKGEVKSPAGNEKEDWRQFFDKKSGKSFELKGEKPDFSDGGWAKPSRKKKK
ncbi:MAG: DEAD/DEAH box helicase [Bacteroidaceae bacterium]|jgi:ATP-dependent RNA helicase DeaD